jgi:GAF domain-containing protein
MNATGASGPSPGRPPRPTLVAVVTAAVNATGATAGWLLEHRGGELAIVAAHGGPAAWTAALPGRRSAGGTASMVIGSGQPVALQPGSSAMRDELSTELLGRNPVSLLCVPCLDGDDVIGALQLVDKRDGGAFDFDDVELAGLLGTIAGVALREAGAEAVDTPTAEGLARDLARLAETDPARFAAAARVIEALLV